MLSIINYGAYSLSCVSCKITRHSAHDLKSNFHRPEQRTRLCFPARGLHYFATDPIQYNNINGVAFSVGNSVCFLETFPPTWPLIYNIVDRIDAMIKYVFVKIDRCVVLPSVALKQNLFWGSELEYSWILIKKWSVRKRRETGRRRSIGRSRG